MSLPCQAVSRLSWLFAVLWWTSTPAATLFEPDLAVLQATPYKVDWANLPLRSQMFRPVAICPVYEGEQLIGYTDLPLLEVWHYLMFDYLGTGLAADFELRVGDWEVPADIATRHHADVAQAFQQVRLVPAEGSPRVAFRASLWDPFDGTLLKEIRSSFTPTSYPLTAFQALADKNNPPVTPLQYLGHIVLKIERVDGVMRATLPSKWLDLSYARGSTAPDKPQIQRTAIPGFSHLFNRLNGSNPETSFLPQSRSWQPDGTLLPAPDRSQISLWLANGYLPLTRSDHPLCAISAAVRSRSGPVSPEDELLGRAMYAVGYRVRIERNRP